MENTNVLQAVGFGTTGEQTLDIFIWHLDSFQWRPISLSGRSPIGSLK